ncbi:MAG: biotin-dependent carboxyltransferase family protein [Actinobacteria bacterium]|nr:biotin-dependent carboxyltransferase family protein [Actinomycetota bacterium]
MIRVIAAGPLATIQDLGRPGHAQLGVGASGAADRPSFRLANRLVGNPEGAPAIEVTFGGLAISSDRGMWVALCGAPVPATADGHTVPMNAPVHVPAGQLLRLGHPTTGVRTYLAVRGGIDVPAVLGSRSTDTLAQLGPAPLRAGQELPVGRCPTTHPNVEVAPVAGLPDEPVLRMRRGPRWDWVDAGARAALARQRWLVGADSDRIGVRLVGPALHRERRDELPPEGLVAGAVQLPPDGQPIIFLADHPVTGGYPVIAVLLAADLALLAQVRPGQRVRLRWRDPDELAARRLSRPCVPVRPH